MMELNAVCLKKDLSNANAAGQAVLAAKANKDLSNCPKPYIVETYRNGTEWFRRWSDGWIEQGGLAIQAVTSNVVFLKPFSDTNFSVTAIKVIQNTPRDFPIVIYAISNSTITFGTGGDLAPIKWRACGY